jgi:hypothetical protein
LPPTEPVDQGDEGEWDTVGEAAGSRSPAPTVEELLAQMERQSPAPQGSTEPAAAAAEEVVAAEAQESAAPAVVAAERAAAVEAQERAPTVTTPPEIIPYYRLNHSIWSSSNNKEVSRWVLPGYRPVNHLTTQRGSNVCIKTPTKESPECLTN